MGIFSRETKEKVEINGRTFDVEMSRKPGSYAIARVSGNTIIIRVPHRLGHEAASKLFLNLKERMVKRLEREGPEATKPEYLTFYDGQILQISGNEYSVRIIEAQSGSSRSKVKDKTLTVKLSSSVGPGEQDRHVYLLSKRAITRSLLPGVSQRVNEINSQYFGSSIRKVNLRDQTGRWGSYSKKTNSIQLNFRLLFAPTDILDYVIVHELAHTKELNHSPRFWKLVAQAVPEFKEKRKWLRENGNMIGVYPKPRVEDGAFAHGLRQES